MIDKCTTELCLQSILGVGVCICVSGFVLSSVWQCVFLISVLVRLRLDPVSKKNQTKTLVYILSITDESKFAPVLSVSLEQEDKVWKTNLFRKVWEKINK